MEKFKLLDLFKLIISLLICQLIGFIGSWFTTPAIPWYQTLQKPAFTPPNWLFAPVWLTLFSLMGISAFLIWQKGFNKLPVKRALSLFLLQLIINLFWSMAFFGLHSSLLGLIMIIMLWILILINIIAFFSISSLAAWLLFPYLLWVSFATYLNYGFMILNVK